MSVHILHLKSLSSCLNLKFDFTCLKHKFKAIFCLFVGL
jgi:hypothetical protein